VVAEEFGILMKGSGGVEFHEDLSDVWTELYNKGSFKRRMGIFCSTLDTCVLPGQRWLDLGCGSGILSMELAKRGATVLGIDASSGMIASSKRLAADANLKDVEFMLCDVGEVDWQAIGSFDGILCSSLIEYLDNPIEILEHCCRALKVRGNILVSAPPRWSFVRLGQRLVRRCSSFMNLDYLSYIEYSKSELDPSDMMGAMKKQHVYIVKRFNFDPVLPSVLQSYLGSSLILYHGERDDGLIA
jgi:ubiquinone/menaquinone biosynthesis C-methylase UbiE